MINILAQYNEDIDKLIKRGYALSIDSNYLVVRDIPYLDDEGNLKIGAIVSKLVFIDKEHVTAQDHQIFFCGSHPYELTGKKIMNLGGGPVSISLSSKDLMVERSFSNKPPSGKYDDWFQKIETYVNIISGPAMNKFEVHPYTFRVLDEVSDSVFNFRDTLTSRAEIGDLSARFEKEVVAVIGLGGTGAYLLDFLVKTPVAEIRGFDNDDYHIHTAYRSPGRLEEKELGMKKSEVYEGRYSNFRKNLHLFPKYIQSDSNEDFDRVTFAFVCIDKGSARKEIFQLLAKLKIPFIDVGMGLDREKKSIGGMLRMTYYPVDSVQSIIDKNLVPFEDIPEDDLYKTNIQISELNAMNASLAMIKYKQIKGFYCDENSFYHVLFNLEEMKCLGES
jgi:hypothetical protein